MVTNVYLIRTIERCLTSLHNAAHQNVHSLDTVATILKKMLKKEKSIPFRFKDIRISNR